MRPQIQEVGPCGQGVEGRLGGLQAWGRRNGVINSAPRTEDINDKGQQTVPKEAQERPRTRVWTRARPSTPPPTPRLPYDTYSPPVGHFMAPHRCSHCDDIPENMFPLSPYSVNDPNPPTCYKDMFPPGYTPFPNPNTHLCPDMTRQPIPSIPLDPTPPYDSLFATAAPQDCCDPPNFPDYWSDPYLWETDAGSDWDL